MAIHNADIDEALNRLADLLEIEEASPFRVRACRRAAVTITELPTSCAAMVETGGDLTESPGVGEDLAGEIREICETGSPGLLKEAGAMRARVDQAQRGWLERGDVLNARPWPALNKLLAR